MQTTTAPKFNLGDLVFSLESGWGNICSIDHKADFPISTQKESFLLNGKAFSGDFAPKLFTKEEALQKFPEFPPPLKQTVTLYIGIYRDGRGTFFRTTNAYLYKEVLQGHIDSSSGDYEVIEVKVDL